MVYELPLPAHESTFKGSIWAVDNPEYYAAKNDPRATSGPNATLLAVRKEERGEERQELETSDAEGEAKATSAELRDELDSDSHVDLDENVVPRTHSWPIGSKRKRKDIEETTLELSTTTITQLLKPFKAALPNLVANLVEFPDLTPYIAAPPNQKSKSCDTSSEESSANEDGHQLRQGYVSTCKPTPYPLTEQQLAVLEECRQVGTLHFSGLPTYDNMIKLIAISINVCIPFFDEVLFPNVEKVIFSSKTQEKSFESRHLLAVSSTVSVVQPIYALPHPITFALDWLVNEFSLCIHSPTSFFKRTWIESQMKKNRLASNETEDEKREKYRGQYNSLNPLAGTIAVDKLPGLQSISYHNVLPGDRPELPPNTEAYLYFGRHEEVIDREADATLRAVAEPLSRTDFSQAPLKKLNLIDVEYLGAPTDRKLGPIVLEQRRQQRSFLRQRL